MTKPKPKKAAAPKAPEAPPSTDTRRVLPSGEMTEHDCPRCHDTGQLDVGQSGPAAVKPCPDCA